MTSWSDSTNILDLLSNFFHFVRNVGLNGCSRQSLAFTERYIKTLPQISKSLFLSLPFLLSFCEGVEAFKTSHNKSFIFAVLSQNKKVVVLDKSSLRNTASLCHCKTRFRMIACAKEISACFHLMEPPAQQFLGWAPEQRSSTGCEGNIQYILCSTGMKWS